MTYEIPKAVSLTEAESELYSRILESSPDDNWDETGEAMADLVQSLLERNAVPEIRLRLFEDSAYAETGEKSPKQKFETKGTTGDKIFRHPGFIPYLCHWIKGPLLPTPAIEGLCDILNKDSGTSGMVMKQYKKHARQCVRDSSLEPINAAKEFYRLGTEIGMEKRTPEL